MSSRIRFSDTATALLDERPDTALVWAEIGGRLFPEAIARHPHRVINVGIREQLLVSTAAGLALTGLRPMVHTFGSFLVERAFEQIKLDFCHQGVGGVLVGMGGSFDASSAGRTHQSPGDVALLDTLPEVAIHAPGTPDETEAALRAAMSGNGLHYLRVVEQTNATSFAPGRLHVLRQGAGPVVVVFGPLLDAARAATDGLDATVLYSPTVRPFDATGLRAALPAALPGVTPAVVPEVVVVEPWLAGTSTWVVAEALAGLPHRVLALGVSRQELRRYGTPAEHQSAHGLDPAGLRRSITAFTQRLWP